jgi:hypothetical protein
VLAAITFWSVPTWWPVALGLLAAVSLLLVVAALLVDWRLRVRTWRTDPANLVTPPPPHRRLYNLTLVLCGLVGLGSLAAPGAAVTPLAVLVAAYTTLTIGHRRCSNRSGGFGLLLVGLAVITAATAWLPTSPANATLGAALAGLLLLWLARFWHQQLNNGRPWTTTGRLIPAARTLSRWIAACECGFVGVWVSGDIALSWQTVLAIGLVLLHWRALVRGYQKGG